MSWMKAELRPSCCHQLNAYGINDKNLGWVFQLWSRDIHVNVGLVLLCRIFDPQLNFKPDLHFVTKVLPIPQLFCCGHFFFAKPQSRQGIGSTGGIWKALDLLVELKYAKIVMFFKKGAKSDYGNWFLCCLAQRHSSPGSPFPLPRDQIAVIWIKAWILAI